MIITKRLRYILVSLISGGGFLALGFLENELRFVGIAILTIATAMLSAWCLWEGLGLNATLLSLILPTFFTLGVGIFWFLLPSSIVTQLPVALFYGTGMYALVATMNIFTVSLSSDRSIALVRAAKGVSFVLSLFTFFLLCDAILSLKISLPLSAIGIFMICFWLCLQGLWTSDLDHRLSRKLIVYSLVVAYSITAISVLLFFWPVSLIVGSLFLTVSFYMLLGFGQAQIEARLFKSTVREYLIVGGIVFFVMFIVTSWRG